MSKQMNDKEEEHHVIFIDCLKKMYLKREDF
jgi:hypothetical protein